MDTVILYLINDNIFGIKIGESFAGRQLVKFNIFIRSIGDNRISNDGEIYSLDFGASSENVVADRLNEIIAFIKKQGKECLLDETVESIVSYRNEQIADFQNTQQNLIEIKNDSIKAQESFKEFCAFCDKTLSITLRDYQYKAALLLSTGKGGFDFSVPGAGKTIISYATYAYLKTKGDISSILVVGPSSSYNAWYDEYVNCFGKKPDFQNLSNLSAKDCETYLIASSKNHCEISFINLEKIRLLKDQVISFLRQNKRLLIVDEAHKVKNPNAISTKSILEIAKYACGSIVLTGTPMPNGYEDLYSLTKIVSPFDDVLPFNYNHLRLMTKSEATNGDVEKLRDALRPYYSRVSKQQLIDRKELLPSKSNAVYCTMDECQDILYRKLDSFCGKIKDEIDEDLLASLKKAVLIRKMQISANPALLKSSIIKSMDELSEAYESDSLRHNEDLDKLICIDKKLMSEYAKSSIMSIVNQFSSGNLVPSKNIKAADLTVYLRSEGKKVLLWDIFVKNMQDLKQIIEQKTGEKVELINGSVSLEDRQESIRNFREGNSNILLANPATLAESISLHRACQNAIYVNMNFNAAQYIQSKDRIHRINMPDGTTATYYFIMNSGSVDECVAERLKEKEARMLKILDAEDIEVGGAEFEDGSIMSDYDIESSYQK